MVLTPSICRRPRRIDLAVFSDIASLQSDPLRGREQQSLVEGVTTGAPEIKAHFVRTGCKNLIDRATEGAYSPFYETSPHNPGEPPNCLYKPFYGFSQRGEFERDSFLCDLQLARHDLSSAIRWNCGL